MLSPSDFVCLFWVREFESSRLPTWHNSVHMVETCGQLQLCLYNIYFYKPKRRQVRTQQSWKSGRIYKGNDPQMQNVSNYLLTLVTLCGSYTLFFPHLCPVLHENYYSLQFHSWTHGVLLRGNITMSNREHKTLWFSGRYNDNYKVIMLPASLNPNIDMDDYCHRSVFTPQTYLCIKNVR